MSAMSPLDRLAHEGVDSPPRQLGLRGEVRGLRDRGVVRRGGVRELRHERPAPVYPDVAGERRLRDVAQRPEQRGRRGAAQHVERLRPQEAQELAPRPGGANVLLNSFARWMGNTNLGAQWFNVSCTVR